MIFILTASVGAIRISRTFCVENDIINITDIDLRGQIYK